LIARDSVVVHKMIGEEINGKENRERTAANSKENTRES
jgi:hypothetical protein